VLDNAVLKSIQTAAGSISGVASLTGNLFSQMLLGGSIPGQSSVVGNIHAVKSIAGMLAGQSILSGNIGEIGALTLDGAITGQSSISGNIIFCLGSMPPEMKAMLIDPYTDGAWIWLVEIKLPGYPTIRYARNPADIIYGGVTFPKGNFDPGLSSLSGDGSVPRITLRVAQNSSLEDKINATEGGAGGKITLIRAHQDFLTVPIVELEQIVNILTSESDSDNINISCGIANPFQKKIPLRRYTSKICPYARPGLFGGSECQYDGADSFCLGRYEDCIEKENEEHFGADLGLDPNALRV